MQIPQYLDQSCESLKKFRLCSPKHRRARQRMQIGISLSVHFLPFNNSAPDLLCFQRYSIATSVTREETSRKW